MPYLYFGKKTLDVGFNLYELLSMLPKRGVGRLVQANYDAKHFTEPTFYRILSVTPQQLKAGEGPNVIKVEKWHRAQYVGESVMEGTEAVKNDYCLIPKTEEKKYLDTVAQYKPPPMRILPNTLAVPPLLRLHLEQRYKLKVERIPLHLTKTGMYTKLATDGEQPNVHTNEVDGIGSTCQTQLYEGVDLSSATYPPHTDTPMPPPSLRIQLPNTPPEPTQ